MEKKRGLGRGLSALIGEGGQAGSLEFGPLEVRVEAILANPWQPRRKVAERELKALADSIRDKGLLEPLLVRRVAPDQFELIAGERRWRAAQAAGLTRVPVVVREASPAEMLELALIENLHREDLNPVEEAESYQRLAREFSRTQEEIARLAGKDRSTVANLMRLLALPEPVQEDIRQGRLSAGHGRALLALIQPERILELREQILARGLNVRQTEALVKAVLAAPARPGRRSGDEVYFQALAEAMSRSLGAKVRIVNRGRRRVEIAYKSGADLDRLLKILGIGPI